MTRLSDDANAARYAVEDALAELDAVVYFLEHDELRIRQALRRACGLNELLDPVLENHDSIIRTLRSVKGSLEKVWNDGQGSRWVFSVTSAADTVSIPSYSDLQSCSEDLQK